MANKLAYLEINDAGNQVWEPRKGAGKLIKVYIMMACIIIFTI